MPKRHVLWVLPLAALAACAPPDPIDTTNLPGDPSISIVYPPADIGEIGINADGYVPNIIVAVDVENLELVPPGEVVDGQGHYHLAITPTAWYAPVSEEYFEGQVPGDGNPLTAGNVYAITVSLQQSDHTPIECDTCVSSVEFTAVALPDDDTDGS